MISTSYHQLQQPLNAHKHLSRQIASSFHTTTSSTSYTSEKMSTQPTRSRNTTIDASTSLVHGSADIHTFPGSSTGLAAPYTYRSTGLLSGRPIEIYASSPNNSNRSTDFGTPSACGSILIFNPSSPPSSIRNIGIAHGTSIKTLEGVVKKTPMSRPRSMKHVRFHLSCCLLLGSLLLFLVLGDAEPVDFGALKDEEKTRN